MDILLPQRQRAHSAHSPYRCNFPQETLKWALLLALESEHCGVETEFDASLGDAEQA